MANSQRWRKSGSDKRFFCLQMRTSLKNPSKLFPPHILHSPYPRPVSSLHLNPSKFPDSPKCAPAHFHNPTLLYSPSAAANGLQTWVYRSKTKILNCPVQEPLHLCVFFTVFCSWSSLGAVCFSEIVASTQTGGYFS